MSTALCTLCAGVLLLFSSFSWAVEPAEDGKTYELSTEDSKLARALAFYAQGLYYLRETPTAEHRARTVRSFRSALAFDPAALPVRRALIEALLAADDVSGAVQEQLVLARMCPDHPRLWLNAYSLARVSDDLDALAETLIAIEAVTEASWQREGVDASWPLSALICGLARLGDSEKSHVLFRAFIATASSEDQAGSVPVSSPLDCTLDLVRMLHADQISDEAFSGYLRDLSESEHFAHTMPQVLMRIAEFFSESEHPDFVRATAFRLHALKLDPMAYSTVFLIVFPTPRSLEGLDPAVAADAIRAFTHSPELDFPFSLLRLELLVAASSWDAAGSEWEKLQVVQTALPPRANLPEAYYLLGGIVLDHRGQTPALLDLLNAGLLAYPESHNIMNTIAYTLAVAGRELPRAIELIDCALETMPEQYAYLDTLGWVLYKMGDYEGAFRSLSNALAYAHEDNHELYDHIGDVLLKLGRNAEAPIWWAKSYSLHPDPIVSEKLRAAGIDPEALP